MNSKFYFFGPLLFHTELQEKNLKEIESLCHRNDNYNHRKKLVGHINDEFKINRSKLEYILNSYFDLYKNSYRQFYGSDIDFYITSSWVNYMKAGDFNPIHTHNDCVSSGVLFLSIPDEIKNENLNFKGNKDLESDGPGEIRFVMSQPIDSFITQKGFFPKRGDLFIFPHNLPHYVAPFKSNVERVSVAFNLKEKT
jgi:hypothetical protein